jgi:hypothetical protein
MTELHTKISITAGREAFQFYPDFAIVRITSQPNPPRDHRLAALVEAKQSDESVDTAVIQCSDYLTQAQRHSSRREELHYYFVRGRKIDVITMGPMVLKGG